MLEISNITKNFDNNLIMNNFNLQVNSGEIVVIKGKSGSGKTTLLRILNNLEKVDQGVVAINEKILCQSDQQNKCSYVKRKQLKDYQSQISMVFQDYGLFNNMNVLENIMEASIALKNESKKTIRQKALALLDKVELSDKQDATIQSLSGGQKQRVAIARALMLQPAFLCFDEPTAALDNESISKVKELIESIAKQGTGVIIVTHNLEFAQSIATRVVDSTSFINN